MSDSIELVWYLFEKTGDPRYYMLYSSLSSVEMESTASKKDKLLDLDEGMSL